jgi:hypothetical protein
MTVTANATLTAGIGTASTTVSKTLPAVPAGATIVAGIMNRTDETTTLSSLSDDIDGAWTPDLVNGALYDWPTGTARQWFAYRHNATGGATTITATFSGAINSQLCVGYITSDQGVMTYEGAATIQNRSGSSGTDGDSNTYAASGAGCIVGFLAASTAQGDPEPTADGAGESRITSGQGGGRAFLFFEPYATAGTYGLEITMDTTNSVVQVGAFLEPGGGSSIAPLAAAYYYN